MSFPRPQIRRPGQDWLPIWVLLKRRKQKQLHKQKQLQLPHEQQKQKQLQQLQLHTTEAATVPETEATTGNNSYSYVTLQKQNTLQLHTIMRTEHPDTKTRPDTTRHNRTPKHNQLHTTITHTSAGNMSIEAPETSYTPHTETHTHTHTSTRKPTPTHRQTCTQTPDTLFERLWSFGFGVSRVVQGAKVLGLR